MDPVSVFRALHDSKCIKFGPHHLKSGLVAPYYINLRRLPLHPKLMEAVVSQVVEKFLTPHALGSIMSQMRRQQLKEQQLQCDRGSLDGSFARSFDNQQVKACSTVSQESDADSQLEDEIETCSEEGCEENEHSSFRPIISGGPHGAVPLAATVAYKAGLPLLLERKEANRFGEQQSLVNELVSDAALSGAHDDGAGQSVVLIQDVICSGESTLEAVRSIERLGLRVEFVVCIVDREENGINLLLEQQGIRVFSLYNMIAILRVLEATGRITPESFASTRQWITNNQFKSISVNPSVPQTTTTTTTTRKVLARQQADSTRAPVKLDLSAIEVAASN